MANERRMRWLVWRCARRVTALATIVISAIAIANVLIPTPVEAQQREKLGLPLPGAPGDETTTLPLPDKPSIAVLAFTNMSGDPEQEYFADGMAEDIITDLSQISGLFVISRSSSFAYKGKSPDLRAVGRELGVKFVLEGSVRRAGDTVRINAQLIDTTTGGHLWAKRFDGKFQDVFALQDQVTQRIVTALAAQLTPKEQVQVAKKETDSVEAYDAFLQGWAHFQRFTADDAAAAIPHFERAIALDPEYGRAYAALAITYWEAAESRWYHRLGLSIGGAQNKAEAFLALAMEHPTALALRVNADMIVATRSDAALAGAERAVAMEPNSPDGHLILAEVLIKKGEHDKALNAVKDAKRLDPQNPHIYDYFSGVALFHLERFEEAATAIERVIALNPEDVNAYSFLAATYGQLDRRDEARAATEQWNVLRKSRGQPTGSLHIADFWTFISTDTERFRDGLRLAGVPEVPDEFATRQQDLLKGPELSALVKNWWYGNDPRYGEDYWVSYNGDELKICCAWGAGEGRWYIEGDNICTVFTAYGVLCHDVYRNPEGTRANNDEYTFVLPLGSFPFSVYAERPLALKVE